MRILKKIGVLLLTVHILFTGTTILLAEGEGWQFPGTNVGTPYVQYPLAGVMNIIHSVMTDTFNPWTHFRSDTWAVAVSINYFDVETVIVMPDEGTDYDQTGKGDGFTGGSVSLRYNYALSDDWMIFGIYTGVFMKGKVIYNSPTQLSGGGYSPPDDRYVFDGPSQAHVGILGLGYDFFNGPEWSFPIFVGGSILKYRSDLTISPLPGETGNPYMEMEADGISYGIYVSLAISRTLFSFLKITPYITIHQLLNTPEGTVTVTGDNPSGPNADFYIGNSATGEIGEEGYLGAGLNITYLGAGPLSYSISVSGIINSHTNFYNDAFHESLEMKSYSFSITYDTNFSE